MTVSPRHSVSQRIILFLNILNYSLQILNITQFRVKDHYWVQEGSPRGEGERMERKVQ